jgi:hypothetical protein
MYFLMLKIPAKNRYILVYTVKIYHTAVFWVMTLGRVFGAVNKECTKLHLFNYYCYGNPRNIHTFILNDTNVALCSA